MRGGSLTQYVFRPSWSGREWVHGGTDQDRSTHRAGILTIGSQCHVKWTVSGGYRTGHWTNLETVLKRKAGDILKAVMKARGQYGYKKAKRRVSDIFGRK